MTLSVVRAATAREAAAILAAERGARFVAGGTLIVRAVNYGDGAIDKLVLSDGLGLDRIVFDGNRVTLGAAATMAQVAAEPKLAFLKPVAESIGGPAVRAMATVGGNLFARYPFGDFAVALLALGATATVEKTGGTETADIADVIGETDRAARGIVLSVSFDLPPDGAFRFVKAIRRKPHGAAVVAIAALLPVADGKVTGARVAYGAMAPTAIRATAVERALEGRPPGAKAIEAAVKVATEGRTPLSDPQASDWYRLAVLPVHLRRLLSGED